MKKNNEVAFIDIFEKRIQLLLEGYNIVVKPKNLFSKIFWRFIGVDVLILDRPKLCDLLPKTKIKIPKFKKNIGEID